MTKTASGLVEYAKAQLGKPYWWGCYGQLATAAVFASKRAQYPDYYTAGDFAAQYGQKVHDCVGLIKGYLWCDGPEDGSPAYNGAQDVAVSGLYLACSRKGTLSCMPDVPGVCVFMASMGHVGVYIGNGEVIEAQGHAYGVVKTRLDGRGWAFWGMPTWIDYSDAAAEEQAAETAPACSVEAPELSFGCRGEAVRSLQLLLIGKGLSVGVDGADGDFGANTRAAVVHFQVQSGLADDGVCGKMTWAALIGAAERR